MTRRESIGFVILNDSSAVKICQKCYNEGIEAKLVPYFMEDGRPDTGFMRCPNCAAAIRVGQIKYRSMDAPLGSANPSKGMEYGAVTKSSRRKVRDSPFAKVEAQDIPKMGKLEDKDLAVLVSEGGIISSISDSNIVEE